MNDSPFMESSPMITLNNTLNKEGELEKILNCTPFLLTRCSRDLRYLYVSKAYATMIRRAPDQVAGKPIVEIMGPQGFETIRPYLETVLRGRLVEYEAEIHFAGVGLRHLHVNYVPDLDERNQVIGWIASIIDITERKKAARERERLEKLVIERTEELAQRREREDAQIAVAQTQKMEAIGQLTAGIAHDFNNLLTVVSGHIELAMPCIEDERARYSVQKAVEAIETMAGLNRKMLSFARQRELASAVLILNDRISEVTKLLQGTIGKQIALATKLGADLWQTRADPVEVDNALLNIVLNARDAMQGGGTLSIETRNVTLDAAVAREHDIQPGEYVRLSVTDTGHGMSSEVRRRAVEPFFTTKEIGRGTGLGLSIVYGFARQSGGFLTIESEVGKGTTVCIFLPRAVLETAAISLSRTEDHVPMGDGEMILVVEDNDDVREVTLGRLESLGYAVLAARSGLEAVEILKGDAPVVLVFSDIMMPGGMTGCDIARWAQTTRQDLKVLLTSGHNEAARNETEEFDGLKVLRKPYNLARLGYAIHEALACEEIAGDLAHKSSRRAAKLTLPRPAAFNFKHQRPT